MKPALPKESQKPVVGNTLTPSRKFVVRLSLATGATFATLIGAQILALMDAPNATASVTAQQPTVSAAVIAPPNAAPQIVIVRNAGNPASTPLPRRNVAPSQNVAAPPPIVDAPIQPEPASQASR
jgi:hypothetical protein